MGQHVPNRQWIHRRPRPYGKSEYTVFNIHTLDAENLEVDFPKSKSSVKLPRGDARILARRLLAALEETR